MNVQNISGPDIVTTSMSISTDAGTRSSQPEQSSKNESSRPTEENKGKNIDAYA